jgi:hypothetical protein
MAGVMMPGDEGMEVQKQQVTAIGGAEYRTAHGLPPTVPNVASAHIDQMNSYPTYPETPGVSLDGGAYPAGTAMVDTTPGEFIN